MKRKLLFLRRQKLWNVMVWKEEPLQRYMNWENRPFS
nr:MAG TPA: hypothetical protein [Caudoviricetes sp.]